MLFLTILITTSYTILIVSFIIGFDKVKLFQSKATEAKNSFSIIIPFRNEVENLTALLNSLSKLDYPTDLFEIIMVDDDSTDSSVSIINRRFLDCARNDIKVINNIRKSNSPKKDAIETAIKQAKHDWIITTDADCIVSTNWLKTFDSFIQENNPKMICAPVTYKIQKSFLDTFQLLDFISLIGSTIGGFGIGKPFLCNGANLCYSKKIFFDVNGFEGNNNIASGDDIFLLEKINKKHPNSIYYLKSTEALVKTKPQSSLQKLISQRIRWASKTTATENWFGKLVGISVFLMNLLIVTLLILSISSISSWFLLLFFFLVKFGVDCILILKTLNFTKQSKNMLFYPIITLFYPFFIVFVSFLSIFKIKFYWKEREFSS